MTSETETATHTDVMHQAMTIRSWMMEPGHQSITFMDFAPTDTTGFLAIFAEKFGCLKGSEALVREALAELDQTGVIELERSPQSETRSGSKGKYYPAQVRVTARLR